MRNYGYAARLYAHMREIRDVLDEVIREAERNENADLNALIRILNDNPRIPWKYGSISKQIFSKYDEILYTGRDELIKETSDIIALLDKLKNEDPEGYELERACIHTGTIGTMAWKLERMERNQDENAEYLTFETDDVTLRLMSAAYEERLSRHDGQSEEDLFIPKFRFSDTLEKPKNAHLGNAQKLLQRLYDYRGDKAVMKDSYQIDKSDIEDLRRFRIEAINGRILSVTVYSSETIAWINCEDILINLSIPDSRKAAIIGTPLEDHFRHPLTNNLDLVIEQVSITQSAQIPGTRLITNAWRRERLVPLTIKVTR